MIIDIDTGLIKGSRAQFIQFPEGEVQFFCIENDISGLPTTKVLDDWNQIRYLDKVQNLTKDEVKHLNLQNLGGFGVIGAYKMDTENYEEQKLIIYEYSYDVSDYVESGTIKKDIESLVDTLSIELANIYDYETNDRFLVGTKGGVLKPGGKVTCTFSLGNHEIPLGSFYVDRVSSGARTPTVSCECRNYIGKALNDQTLNDDIYYSDAPILTTIDHLIKSSGAKPDSYFIQESDGNTAEQSFVFSPNTTILDAITSVLKFQPEYRIAEYSDGRIVVGKDSYKMHEKVGEYVFELSEIIERSVILDDINSYSMVCVQTSEEYPVTVTHKVRGYTGWNLQSKKTFFAEMPEGTKEFDMHVLAIRLAAELESAGKLETIKTPIKPHLSVYDKIKVKDSSNVTNLGSITGITHSFGKGGYFSEITIDSGGRYGGGRISKLIEMMQHSSASKTKYKEEQTQPTP